MKILRATLGVLWVFGLLASGCGRTHDGRYDDYPGLRAASGGKGGGSGASGGGASGGGNGGNAASAGDPGVGGSAGAIIGGVGGPFPAGTTAPPPFCGNGNLEQFEECEGDLRLTCTEIGLGVGSVRCDPNTCRLDTSRCTDRPMMCSNDAPDFISPLCIAALCRCDPGLVANCGASCWSTIECRVHACGSAAWDPGCQPNACPNFSQQHQLGQKLLSCAQGSRFCGLDPNTQICGNGVVEGFEQCDREDLNGISCQSLGFDAGTLFCSEGCTPDTSKCFFVDPAFCGNGVIDPGERCDGRNLAGESCKSFGFPGGRLACSGCNFDTSRCGRGLCGNDAIDSGEQCDGSRLGGRTCSQLGFGSGLLQCGGDCQFDSSLCALCGNGAIEAGENCDNGNLGGASCATLGLGGGNLGCSPTSCHFDTRGCNAGSKCGNGVAEADEDCDGMDFTAHSCDTLGFRFGNLGCNQATCRFDVSGCTGSGTIECVDTCIDDSCLGLVEQCLASPDCQKIRSCLDSCRADPSVNCGLACTGNLAGVALATVASDCVADCVDGCR